MMRFNFKSSTFGSRFRIQLVVVDEEIQHLVPDLRFNFWFQIQNSVWGSRWWDSALVPDLEFSFWFPIRDSAFGCTW